MPRLTKLPWIPTEPEWLAFLTAFRGEPARNRLMLALAYDAALRREELCSLRTDDLERFAFRILTVNVTEGLRGQAEAQVSVLEEGGVVPYALAAKDIPPKDSDTRAPRSTEGYIDFRFMGARHSEPGDEVILFLGLNPNRGTVIETTYNMISSVHGRFTYDTKSNAFVRSLGSPDRDLRAGFVKSADIGELKAEIAAAHP